MTALTIGEVLGTIALIFVAGIIFWIVLFVAIHDAIKDRRKQRRKDREHLAAWEAAAPEREARQRAQFERDLAQRAEDRYGPAHQALRRGWKDVIRQVGADCMERECLMPSRRIPAGAAWDEWDLAHDHEAKGDHEYLGPAHKACNQAESLRRGVTWEGAPTLDELLRSVGRGRAERPSAPTDPWASAPEPTAKPSTPDDPWAPGRDVPF